MWQKVVAKAQELIKYAEGMKDKTGPEKKAIVVKLLCDEINIPGVPDWIERMIEPPLYGFIVDLLVKWWNSLTGHQLETIPENDAITAQMADVVKQEIASISSNTPLDVVDINSKFDALLEQYGVKG